MILKKKQMTKRFNRAAKTYDLYAEIPRKMAHRLIYTCRERQIEAKQILEIGCGTGFCTTLLQDLYPHGEIHAIDFAEKMIEEARRISSSPHITFQVADAEEDGWQLAEEYDLIVMNATMHWFSDPASVLEKCYQMLAPDGYLIASTFGPDTFQELRMMFEVVELDYGMDPACHVLRLCDATSWKERARAAKFHPIHLEEQWHQEHYRDCRQFLTTIQSTGSSYSEDRQSLYVSRKILPKVMEKYDVYFRDRRGVYVTYHLFQLIGKKELVGVP